MSSTPPPAGRGLKRAGVLTILLGLLCVALAATPVVHAFSSTFVDELRSPVYTAPFDRMVTLNRGKYLLLESEGSTAQVAPDEVRVLDVGGATPVDARQSGGNYTVSRNNERFVDVLEFTTSHSGRYLIEVIEPPDARLIVGRDPADAFAGIAQWFLVGGAGLLLVLLGFVLLLVGFSRGRPAGRPPVLVHYGQPYQGQPYQGQPYQGQPYQGQQPPHWLPPPGWYPDPQQAGGWRYWDGDRWRP